MRSTCMPSVSGRFVSDNFGASISSIRTILRQKSSCRQPHQVKQAFADENRVGVVVVDHGSRRKESNQMLVAFCDLYRQTSGRNIVEPAHMEIAKPSIEDAVGKCVQQGATHIIVAPYFLSKGRHIQEDIPALVEAAQQRFPSTKCVVAEPVGIDPLMAQLIENRVQSVSTAL